jgi:creatinine amidohydrolase
MRVTSFLFVFLTSVTAIASAQDLPSRWDELTASDWPKAMERSGQTCILPIGILEKHGPHAPIGADVIHVREIAARATKTEYAVVFPDYFYGQINEARHQPGTFALPSRVVWDLLEATCDEMGRNGFKHVVILNGHGGNPELLRYFIQTRLERRRDYVVYFYTPATDSAEQAKVQAMRRSDASWDQHAGESETSRLLYTRPDLVQMDRAASESGADQKRLTVPSDLYTAIWWYASFPNHYAGEGAKATRELGQTMVDYQVERFARALRAVKADTRTLELQNEFFDRVDGKPAAKK